MTVLAILGYVAAIVVAIITIWNTATASRLRLRVRAALYARSERKQLTERIKGFAAEPALVEIEDRFDELHSAYISRDVPYDLRILWTKTFWLAGKAPVGPPFRYGALELHWDPSAMTVRKGAASITGWEELDPLKIPPPPHSAMAVNPPPVPVIDKAK